MSVKVNLNYAPALDTLTKELKKQNSLTQSKLKRVAEELRDKTRSFIKAGIKRKGSTGRLERSIKVKRIEDVKDSITYAVGETYDMPEYWYVFNYGGYIPPSSRGYFGNHQRPKSSGGTDRWHQVDSNKESYIVPKKAIKPRRFVEKSHAWLKSKWRTYWRSTAR